MSKPVDAPLCLSPPPPLAALQADGRVAVMLDFDGTLVEIASDPDAIAAPADLAPGLEALAARLDGALAIISGRSIENLTRFLGPLRLTIAGSHGGHIIAGDGTVLREAAALPSDVGAAISSFARTHGLLYEGKAHGAALHYRRRPEMADQACAFVRDLAAQFALATKTGKCVIELVEPGADKGGAVRLLAERAPFAGATPVFIGDDITDEDGFAACNALGGAGIIVGERAQTAARYRLEQVKDVWAWLNL
ncbi:MAG: trehalose-phosphatase [Erythrobacter sp.]